MAKGKHSVDVLIKARDQASKRLNRIAKSTSGLHSAFRKLGAGLAIYFSGRAIKNFSQSSLAAYAKQEDAEGKLRQALKATGGAVNLSFKELKRYAGQLQSTTKFGDELTLSAMSILATFKEIKGKVFKDTTAIALDMSEALGQDLKSSIIQLGKALNDPVRGVSALQDVGVSFTEQQKKQIKAYIDQNELMKAQQVILDELTSEFGGQATAAAKRYNGILQQMRDALNGLREQIGAALMPTFLRWAKAIKKWAEDNKMTVRVWAELFVARLNLVKDVLVAFVDYIKKDWAGAFGFAFKAVIHSAIAFAKTLSVIIAAAVREAFDSLFNIDTRAAGRISEIADELHKGEMSHIKTAKPSANDEIRKRAAEIYQAEKEAERGKKWQGVATQIQNIAKETAAQLKKELPDTVKPSFMEAWEQYHKTIAGMNERIQAELDTDQSGFFKKNVVNQQQANRETKGVRTVESRFLRTAVGSRYATPEKQTEQNTKKTAKGVDKVNETLATISAKLDGNPLSQMAPLGLR